MGPLHIYVVLFLAGRTLNIIETNLIKSMLNCIILFSSVLNFGLSWILVEPMSQPPNAEIYAGYNHTLNCEFKQLVNCIWYRNDSKVPIEITDRYHYVIGNGDNTTDCSVEIEQFQNDDLGGWHCMGNITIDLNGSTLSYLKSKSFINNEIQYYYIN